MDEQETKPADEQENAGAENSEGADTAAKPSEEADEEDGEDARTQGQTPKVVLKDPRTGKPLRDQTVPAKDTGYLGKHDMQDKTERLAPDEPDSEDFKE